MGTSKILIDGVGIDLTQDTVAANKMLSGIKAHDSNGDSVTGNIQTWAGTQASGVKNISANGTYDVSQYASAAVDVPSSPGYYVKTGTLTHSGNFPTITHNLGKTKLLVMMQARGGSTFSSAYKLISGFWLSDELKAAYMTERSYTFSYSSGMPSPTIPLSWIGGEGLNTPAATAIGLIATPNNAINASSANEEAMKTATIDSNSIRLYSRYALQSDVTYDWTVIAFD